MDLFLQGAPRVGKSTLLHGALLPQEAAVAGFMVQRLFEGESMCGFRAMAVQGALPPLEGQWAPGLGGVFLHRGNPVPGVLEETIAQAEALCKSESCRIVLLDEIGGMELLSPAFMQPLRRILALGKPCTGVIKARESLAGMAEKMGLPPDILQQNDALRAALAANGTVLTVTGETLTAAGEAARGFVAAAL